MEHREYQVKAVQGVLDAWTAGHERVLLVAPTGAGKSEMALATIRRALAELRPGVGIGALCIVHTKVLLEQTRRRFPTCTVLTIQSLVAKGHKGDRRRERLARHPVVFIDEAHHLASELWRQVLPALEHALIFGATATPQRSDGTPLGDVFDHMIVAANYTELLRDGFLCRCDVSRSDMSRSSQKRSKQRPDGVLAYLEQGKRVCSGCAYEQRTGEAVPGEGMHECDEEGWTEQSIWRPGIYFNATIEQCDQAKERFNAAGVRAKVVNCNTGGEERQAIFNAYTAGELDMLCSPMALSEGFDSPRAEVCVLCRSSEGIGTFLQIVGRVLRPFPGKERALLIDCAGASEAGHHGLPTNDRIYSLDGKGIKNVPVEEELAEDEEDEEEAAERKRAQEVAAKYSLVRDTLHARYVDLVQEASQSGYAKGWVFHKFSEATTIVPPRSFPAKYQSTCTVCRTKVKLGEDIFWLGASITQHESCWFKALDEATLAKVPEKLPPIPRKRVPRPVVSREQFAAQHGGVIHQQRDIGDDIPF